MSGYQLVPEGGFRVYPLEGGDGHINRYFAQRNRFFSLEHSLCRSCPAALVAGSQLARHKGGG